MSNLQITNFVKVYSAHCNIWFVNYVNVNLLQIVNFYCVHCKKKNHPSCNYTFVCTLYTVKIICRDAYIYICYKLCAFLQWTMYKYFSKSLFSKSGE